MGNIYYKNSNNDVINLSDSNIKIRLKTSMLYNYEWKVNSSEKNSGLGVNISRFEKDPAEISMVIDFCGSADERAEAMQNFFEISEVDILDKSPGKLYRGNQYIEGYFISSEAGYYESINRKVKKEVVFYAPYPFWIEEKELYIAPSEEQTEEAGEYLDYPYDFEYDYTSVADGEISVYNDHYTSSEFVMYMYGPCSNPQLTIGSNTYGMTGQLSDGEYFEIDSIANTIRRKDTTGTFTNELNNRLKTSDIFAKIPKGKSIVTFSSACEVKIILKNERSEVKWK